MPQIDFTSRFPYMTPIKAAPTLSRINGCGVALYGRRDADAETGTFVATYCFSLLFIPLICLRAYRVGRTQGKWYFLGREPLSAFAKGWNVVLLAAVLLTGAGISFSIYASSPAYQAKRRMSEARHLVEKGELTQAAAIYQSLSAAGADEADNAAAAIKDLLENKCSNAPLHESAGVLAAAAKVTDRPGALLPAQLVDDGRSLVVAKGDADPPGAIEVLDVIRPLAVDTRLIDDARLPLLRKWVASDPTSIDAATALAALLEQQDHLPEAKAILLPFKDKLGDGEGARVLGTILGREGDYDGAYALLWPYAKNRLENLHAAEKAADDTMSSLWDREIKDLNDHKGPKDFYDKYDAAGTDAQHALVQEYVNGRIKHDPQFVATQEALERSTAVVPVALDLGMIILQRAQGIADPTARRTQLESAEQVFLAIRGIAGETDEYRLYLGQVYYWLGKQADGRKLFDDLIAAKGRSVTIRLEIAAKLREVGADSDARIMAEQAYADGQNPEEREEAASLRSLLYKDTDDEIAWLRKMNTSAPQTKARLANALGQKAFGEGEDDEAVRQFHVAIDAYSAMPRGATTLNETALAYDMLFRCSGDHQYLDRCLDYFQQAVALSPSDPILIYNAAYTILNAAIADVIGHDIDLQALHRSGDPSLLHYLYQDESGRDAVNARLLTHPGVARALAYFQKVLVLAPKRSDAYGVVYQIHSLAKDDAALHRMEQSLKTAAFDNSDDLAQIMQFRDGAKDAESIAGILAAMKRADDHLPAARKSGNRSAAVLLADQTQNWITLDMIQGNSDPAKVLALAQEADQLATSSATRGALESAYLFRAGKTLRAAEPQFDALCKTHLRLTGLSYLVAVAASEPGPLQAKLLQNPDFQQAIAITRDQITRFPHSVAPYDWALLKNADGPAAASAAEAIRRDPRMLVETAIGDMLNPVSVDQALTTYWLMQVEGQPDAGRAALRKVRDLGLAVPVEP